MNTQELIFTVRLDDGSLAEARAWDPATAATLRKAVKSGRKRLRVRAAAESDTAGHAMAEDTIGVSLALGYDVEGHTLALHFPSVEQARRFQKRLLITGVLAATIVAGAAGADLASQQARSQAPAAGPAITAPAGGASLDQAGPSAADEGAQHAAPRGQTLPK